MFRLLRVVTLGTLACLLGLAVTLGAASAQVSTPPGCVKLADALTLPQEALEVAYNKCLRALYQLLGDAIGGPSESGRYSTSLAWAQHLQFCDETDTPGVCALKLKMIAERRGVPLGVEEAPTSRPPEPPPGATALAQERPILAGSDVRSCLEESNRTGKVRPQCLAVMGSAEIRAAQMVGDEWMVQRSLSSPRFRKICADADDAATCLAKLDAIAGWTTNEAGRAAEELVPRARQCFLYRTEALREARAANDYERIRLLESEGSEICCQEQERVVRDNPRGMIGVDYSWPECPKPPPTPPSNTRAIAWNTQWQDLTIVIILIIGWLIFGLATVRAIIRRTPYGLWWRRAWPKVLIVGGAGLGAYQLSEFSVFRNPLLLAVAAMMILVGAVNLRRPMRADNPHEGEKTGQHDAHESDPRAAGSARTSDGNESRASADDTRRRTYEDPEARYAKVLGLPYNFTAPDIKERYRTLIASYHPDKVRHLGPELQKTADRKTREIIEAYKYFRVKYNLK